MATTTEDPRPTPQPSPEERRTFGITELSVANSTSVFLLTLMILLFGLPAYAIASGE